MGLGREVWVGWCVRRVCAVGQRIGGWGRGKTDRGRLEGTEKGRR